MSVEPYQRGNLPGSGRSSAGSGADALSRLVGGVRTRLWLDAVSAGALRGAWLAAAVAALGAAVHLTLREHAMTSILLIGAAAVVASIVTTGARGRPTEQVAAARADAWFGGRDLLSSAIDLLARRPAKRVAAAQFVLESADERARRWLPRLHPFGASLRLARLFAPGALFGVCLFLYGLPGERSPIDAGEHAVMSRSDSSPLGPQNANIQVEPAGIDAAGLSVWKRSADVGPERVPGKTDDFESSPVVAEPDLQAGDTTSEAGRGAFAGAGSRIEPPPGRPESADFLAVRFVELAATAGRGSDPTSSRGGRGRELTAPSWGSQEAAQVPAIATGGASILGRESTRPALRAYVAEYERMIRELE